MKKLLLIAAIAYGTNAMANGPDEGDAPPLFKTFQSDRIINGHSNEVLAKKMLNFRIAHRFGDIAGGAGDHHTLYGLDQAQDIRIAFEYGVTDKLMIGAGRSKGNTIGPISEIFDGFVKYSLMNQFDGDKPISLAVVGTGSVSGMVASTTVSSAANFRKFAHRLTYTSQLVASRRLSDRLSIAVIPSYTHRNFVAGGDNNGVFAVGAGGVLKITKLMSLTAEYYHTIRNNFTLPNGTSFYQPLAIGLEINTGGHLFQLHLSNSGGIGENQFIAGTQSNWLDGQFRFGFTVSRKFKL